MSLSTTFLKVFYFGLSCPSPSYFLHNYYSISLKFQRDTVLGAVDDFYEFTCVDSLIFSFFQDDKSNAHSKISPILLFHKYISIYEFQISTLLQEKVRQSVLCLDYCNDTKVLG